MQETTRIHKTIECNCPTCGEKSRFEHIGEQKWSAKVAEKLNLPQIINLYNCGSCHTTLTELQFQGAGR